MKMFGPKSLSVYLFYTGRILAVLCSLGTLLFIYVMATNRFSVNGNHLRLELPFTNSHLEVLDEHNIPLMLIISLLFYSLFFYSLSEVFKTFGADKLFTEQVQHKLIHFAYLNLLVPFVYIVLHSMIIQDTHYTQLPYALLHLVLGIIVFFIAALFNQGKQLQSENDLTI